MRLQSYSLIGGRKSQQDNYWCAELESPEGNIGVLCVCDGMGGLSDGNIASSTLCKRVRDYFLVNTDLEGVKGVIQKVNKELRELGGSQNKRLGTTIVVAKVVGQSVSILNVGDSRAYGFYSEAIPGVIDMYERLTLDNSVIEDFQRQGIELSDIEIKKYKNMLSRCVGVKDIVEIDSYNITLDEGNILLLCSDGFWHGLEYIGNVTKNDLGNLETLCNTINSKIKNSDNITACTLEV